MLGVVLLLVFVHFPLLSQNIISADILLNNAFYNGYSWEISLGRFGLFIVGILKSFLSFPPLDFFVSSILVSMILYLLFDLFDVKSIFSKIFITLIFISSPIISATLLFHYCSIAYFLAFLFSILSLYTYYHFSNKWLRILVPAGCIVISLSIYQAYLSFIISLFVIYHLFLIIQKKIDYKKCFFYFVPLFLGIISYFICMKLSLYVFHIDMASYSNANKIGISTILNFPSKIVESYKLFYQFFFQDTIMKNHYFHNNLLHFLLIIMLFITIFSSFYQKKYSKKEIAVILLILLLLPIFFNSVIFVIDEAKLQLLMSSSYLLLPFFVIHNCSRRWEKILISIILIVLIRNYVIQDLSTYSTLQNKFQTYYTIIGNAISKDGDSLDKKYALIGHLPKVESTLSKVYDSNYGYVADEDLFWDEYHLRKLGFERFVSEYYGLNVSYADSDTISSVEEHLDDKLIYEYQDVIVINLNYLK